MTQEIALRTRAVQVVVDIVYNHNLPVQLTLGQNATPSGLRVLTIDYFEEDELLAEWLIHKATTEKDATNAN